MSTTHLYIYIYSVRKFPGSCNPFSPSVSQILKFLDSQDNSLLIFLNKFIFSFRMVRNTKYNFLRLLSIFQLVYLITFHWKSLLLLPFLGEMCSIVQKESVWKTNLNNLYHLKLLFGNFEDKEMGRKWRREGSGPRR